jgi:hypothetical protein
MPCRKYEGCLSNREQIGKFEGETLVSEITGTSGSHECPESVAESATETAQAEHDLEISNHPTYANRAFTTALLRMRTRTMFEMAEPSKGRGHVLKRGALNDHHKKMRASWL